jgi:UTP--glucose-1-phosphate uridylyltransferase
LNNDVPHDFIQHKVPKILKKNLKPANYPENKEYEWCPPGHGDIYNALIVSGILDQLLSKNYKYAFVSNSDNLGGVVNASILGYLAEKGLPFMMEVAKRTPADKKGGHLARMKNGQLILREIAQCPAEDIQNFQNIQKYKYFNTNNLWIDLEALEKKIRSKEKGLTLPMICNEKHLNPRDQSTPRVFQLETAMGSAIARFKNSTAMVVPKKRFLPVKKTNSLLNIRSDNYLLKDNFEIVSNPEREYDKCTINLDPEYYKLIDDMEMRFPYGPPSLIKCSKLNVKGDIKFGKNLEISGEVSLINTDKKQKFISNQEINGKLKL